MRTLTVRARQKCVELTSNRRWVFVCSMMERSAIMGYMDILVLCHRSAFRYWMRSNHVCHPDELRCELPPWDSIIPSKASFGRLRELELTNAFSFEHRREIDLLVDRKLRYLTLANCALHFWDGALPSGALCACNNGVLVASPEMTFVQMASLLPLQALIVCGNALCSSYPLEAANHHSRAWSRTLTTKDRLGRFAELMSGRKGSAKALRALRWVREGAASVREAELASLLFVPRVYAGSGLLPAQLNYRIDLDASARDMARRSYCVADFAWPEKHLVLEYDSDSHHASATAMQSDARRRNALIHMGYDVLTCTNDIFLSNGAMRVLVSELEKKLYPHGRRSYDISVSSYASLRKAAWSITRGDI